MNNDTGKIYPTMREAFAAGSKPSHTMQITPTRQQRRTMQVGRNDLCPCGSGLKFKKCHLGKPASFKP